MRIITLYCSLRKVKNVIEKHYNNKNYVKNRKNNSKLKNIECQI